MLACLRSIARSRPTFRGAFAALSSSAPSSPDTGSLELQELGQTLIEGESGTTTYIPNSNSPYRAFVPNQFIQPHRLAYKSVVKQRGRPPTRAQVGPSRREAQYKDPFYRLGVDPLKQAMNPAMLLPFISEMGKVYGRNVTGLTKKNQRRVGKAIRRAKMMGIIPILSKRNIFQLSHSNISKK
ncbi:mitochondrial ribosomal protein s18 [Lentinula edodes]|uniref:Small ribosomal subunit protein bS18m n=1 Tax=Lentinula edodes TaxID=5353 RepID=A0A1Q3DVV8_LENED|nr:uncharacterized protein C8R40DRAFT_1249681 [Lentinula edodes]KAH7876353.1 hypothetical protein C8R40DRAFT_1249681 [Lentinula edodes]GAV98973.1 mitochondrial ribosomal protein s18 [Lentinula edodes]